MSCLAWLLGGGVVALILRGRNEDRKVKARIRTAEEEERRRQSIECSFDEISRSDFEDIVYEAIRPFKKSKRLKGYSIDEAQITGYISSRSGISDWSFTIDFNDYGHITGDFYWVDRGNSDAEIQYTIAHSIQRSIVDYLD